MAQKNEQGMLAQQDAEECWSLVVHEMITAAPAVESLLTGHMKITLHSAETDESVVSEERFTKLSSHIGQGTASEQVSIGDCAF